MDKSVIHKGDVLTRGECRDEQRQRSRPDDYWDSIAKGDPIPPGWVERVWEDPEAAPKTRAHILKPKTVGEKHEDRLWTLLHGMGAQFLNTRGLELVIRERGGARKTKEIDVLAVIDRTVFVIESKASEKPTTRSLKKDIAEMAKVKKSVERAVCKLLQRSSRGWTRFVWAMATSNIKYTENDRIDLGEHGMMLWDEKDVTSLEELVRLTGNAARYQIYGLLFHDRAIEGRPVRVPAIKSNMGRDPETGETHDYYSFVAHPQQLLEIAYVHRLTQSASYLDVTRLSGAYQRMLSKDRKNKIEAFIRERGGFFPGSVIVNFTRAVTEEPIAEGAGTGADGVELVMLTLPRHYASAWIIDGQHRLYGFADIAERNTETLPIVAFVKEPASVQTKIFVDINENQKKVDASLLYDLYEVLYEDSDNPRELELRAISRIGKLLNSERWSPFQGRIQVPSLQNNGVLNFRPICYEIERLRLVRQQPQGGGLLFCKDYDETVDFAARRVAAFYDVFKSEMPKEWEAGTEHFLCTNAGFIILTGILQDILAGGSLTSAELASLSSYSAKIRRCLKPVVADLRRGPKSRIDGYRATGGAGQVASRARTELTRLVRDKSGVKGAFPWLTKSEGDEQDRAWEEHDELDPYLKLKEGQHLEFKGSLSLDIGRMLKGDGERVDNERIVTDFLSTVVAMLNTQGGEIILGVLEAAKFEGVSTPSDWDVQGDFILPGVQVAYSQRGWDGFQQKVSKLVGSRISKTLVPSYVQVRRIDTDDGKDFCVVTVNPGPEAYFLDDGQYYIRSGADDEPLTAKEAMEHYANRA